MYGLDSPYHILNRWNTHRQSPLYVAAKHGRLDVMVFLIGLGADPKMPSMVSKRESESVLEDSVRWSHVQIVRYLVEHIDWSKDEVQNAMLQVEDDDGNPIIKKMLKDYSKLKFGKIYTCFRSSFLSCLLPSTTSNTVVPMAPTFGSSNYHY